MNNDMQNTSKCKETVPMPTLPEERKQQLLEQIYMRAFYVWRAYRYIGGSMDKGSVLQIEIDSTLWLDFIKSCESMDQFIYHEKKKEISELKHGREPAKQPVGASANANANANASANVNASNAEVGEGEGEAEVVAGLREAANATQSSDEEENAKAQVRISNAAKRVAAKAKRKGRGE